MTKVQWVVQQNLTNSADFLALQAACKNTGVDFTGVDVVPFSTELPLFDRRKRSIFYGSTTFNKLINEDKSLSAGLFFDPGLFSITRYIREWGENMLNYGANTTTFKQLMKEKFDPEKLLFIRPDDDGKSFAGEVIKYGDFVRWFESLQALGNSGISLESKIVVGEPYQIGREWRLWLVSNKVVASSQYRNNFRLEKKRGCPESVITYAEDRCLQFVPHDVFVMDVCECGDKYYVVECNCMNGAGFYSADVNAIVYNVSAYFSGL